MEHSLQGVLGVILLVGVIHMSASFTLKDPRMGMFLLGNNVSETSSTQHSLIRKGRFHEGVHH